jgi:hypothetical protein
MHRILLSLHLLLLTSLFALPALAGNWGENWGTLTWGAAIAAVPTMGKLGVLVLALGLGGLAARFIQRGRAVASLPVIGLVLSMLSPVANAQTVPNIFTDGTPALASEVNENFQALASAVNASDCATAADVVCNTSCPAAPACDTLGSFNQGAASVDITTDNAAFLQQQLPALCAAIQGGGTWNAETSTCTPASAASSYNCFIGGFCAQAAIFFPPAQYGYANVYLGHTQSAEPALGAGCNTFTGSQSWASGANSGGSTPFNSPVQSFQSHGICAE